MKPVKSFCALTLAFLLAFPLAACGTDDPAASDSLLIESLFEWEPIEATVVKCAKLEDGAWDLSIVTENGLATLSCSKVEETAGALMPGALVHITGVVGGSNPFSRQLYGKKICVTVVAQGENFIELYQDMLNYLYNEEPGINPEGSPDFNIHYGIDLTGVHNLSDGEKEALAAFFVGSHDTDWGTGVQPAFGGQATFQGLLDAGEIDPETRRFEHGLLFTIQDEPAENGSFSFSMKKWRSDTEFVSHENCKATKDGDSWTFEVLDESEQEGNL